MNSAQKKQDDLARIREYQNDNQPLRAAEYADELSLSQPHDGEWPQIASILFLAAGNYTRAVACLRRALANDPRNDLLRVHFTTTLAGADVPVYNAAVRSWVETCLNEAGRVNINSIARLWRVNLLGHPEFKPLADGFLLRDYAAFKTWFDTLSPGALLAGVTAYFTEGLRLLIIADTDFERFMMHLRHRLLDYVVSGHKPPKPLVALCAALAQQCFINEYAYYVTTEERTAVEKLLASPARNAFQTLVLACYRPLTHVGGLPGRLTRILNPVLEPVLRQQVDEPLLERQLVAAIPALDHSGNKVSDAVREQYEANPYPRWTALSRAQINIDNLVFSEADRIAEIDVLIAGCGTGAQIVYASGRHPLSRITAFDLSCASLGYARRKINEMGIDNVTFLQGDILNLSKLDKSFDVIESIGVLHHMEDPERGMAELATLLKPGGLMKIALYSELSRSGFVVGTKNFLDTANIPTTDDGIREARKLLNELPDDHALKPVSKAFDFFTTSMFRDAFMHVQEHRFTIPRIEKVLRSLNLEFLGFVKLSPEAEALYKSRYPQDPSMRDLKAWAALEEDQPGTFVSMYYFWCKA